MIGFYDTAVIGLRSGMREDDAFGTLVARQLKASRIDSIDIIEAADCDLLDILNMYRRAVVVCSLSGKENGEVFEAELESGKGWKLPLPPHSMNLLDRLSLLRENGPLVPEFLKVYCAYQPESRQSDAMTGKMQDRVSFVVTRILQTLGGTP
jgi:hydrogenase maturation protease